MGVLRPDMSLLKNMRWGARLKAYTQNWTFIFLVQISDHH